MGRRADPRTVKLDDKQEAAGAQLSRDEQEAAGRRLSCDTDSVDVRRHLSTVLILSILDFAIGFEIDYGPAIEVRGRLLKSKIDNALDEGAILALVLKGCFPSQRDGLLPLAA